MPIETLADYEEVRSALASEMQKPEDQQDMQLIRAAVDELKAAEIRFESQVPKASEQAIQQGALQNLELPSSGYLPQQEAMSQGVNQRLQQIADFVMRPFMDDEKQKELGNERIQQQAAQEIELEERARREGVPASAIRTDRKAGSFIPDLVSGFGVGASIRGARAGSALLRAGAETALGAVGSGADVPLGSDPSFEAALGASIGGTLGILAELPGFARNAVLSDAMRAMKNPQTRRNLALAKSSGIDLSLAEASVDQRVAQMEAAVPNVPGSPRAEFNANRQRQIAQEFAKVDEALNPERLSTETVINNTRSAYEGYVRELGNIASQNFVESLRPVARQLGATIDNQGRIVGGRRVIPVDNLIQEIDTQIKQLGEAVGAASENELRSLQKMKQDFEAAKEAGGLTLGGAQRLLRDYTDQAFPSGTTVTRQRQNGVDVLDARALKNALMDDLQAAADGLSRRGIPSATSSGESTYRDFVSRAFQNYQMEQQGQAVLDDLIERSVAPKNAAAEFWRVTYPKLNSRMQQRFRTYVERLSGFKPGDVVGQAADGSPIQAKDYFDLADFVNDDLATSAEALEGTERGYVALMEWANQQRRAAQSTTTSSAASETARLSGPAASNNEAGQQAAEALLRARERYAGDIDVMNSLQGQMVDRLLGKVGGSLESEEFTKKILSLPTRQFTELMGVLDQTKPGLANAVRARVFLETANQHLRLTARGQARGIPELDIVKFINEFDKMPFDRFRAFIGADTQTTQRVRQGLDILRLIAEGPERAATGRGALQKLEELAINLASHNPGFISRLLAGRLGPGFFQKVLFTPGGLEALETLGTAASAGRTTAAVAATRTLADLANLTDKEREEMLERARQQRVMQNLQNARIGP